MQRERLHGSSQRVHAWRSLWRRPSAGQHKCFPRNWLGHDRHERSSRNPLFSNLPKPDLRLKRLSPHPLSPPAILPRPPSFFCGQRPARCRAKGHRRMLLRGTSNGGSLRLRSLEGTDLPKLAILGRQRAKILAGGRKSRGFGRLGREARPRNRAFGGAANERGWSAADRKSVYNCGLQLFWDGDRGSFSWLEPVAPDGAGP
jgi:hypothetical protein